MCIVLLLFCYLIVLILIAWVSQTEWLCPTTLPCPDSCVKSLSPKVLGGGAFGMRLGPESGTFTDAISVLIKEATESSLAPPTEWGHRVKVTSYEPGSGLSPCKNGPTDHTLPELTSPQNYNECLLFLRYPVYGILL